MKFHIKAEPKGEWEQRSFQGKCSLKAFETEILMVGVNTHNLLRACYVLGTERSMLPIIYHSPKGLLLQKRKLRHREARQLAPGHTVCKPWGWLSSLYVFLQSFLTTAFHCLPSGLGFEKVCRVRFLRQTETAFLVFPDSVGFWLGPRGTIYSWLEKGNCSF